LAVCRLMTNSNLLDCTTGRSAGLVPTFENATDVEYPPGEIVRCCSIHSSSDRRRWQIRGADKSQKWRGELSQSRIVLKQDKKAAERLEDLRTPEDEPIPPNTLAEQVCSTTSVHCAGRRTMPSGTTPSRTSRHKAIRSLRAKATINPDPQYCKAGARRSCQGHVRRAAVLARRCSREGGAA
jgi:hypothetical protein